LVITVLVQKQICERMRKRERRGGVTVYGVRTSRVPRVVLALLPPLHEHFPHTYTSEIRHVNRHYLWPYKR
jgi:hypothetical protein